MLESNTLDYAIEIQDVYKKFKIYSDKNTTLKEKIIFKSRSYTEDRGVLKGINFKVKKGEAIGLIGENGAGKSTMLKLMSRIIYPDKGNIKMQGRISSLIELGAGFHPDMSGRENIYTNASIFGLSKKEIDKRINVIINFSELEKFIDNPVRTYSSGMYMRLAFSVAINVNADILLIDEILAVGDAAFQSKCFNKLREIKNAGTTIVIVSHSLDQIESICEKSIWFKNGIVECIGSPQEVHAYYMDYMVKKQLANNADVGDNVPDGQLIDFTNLNICNMNNNEACYISTGSPILLRINFNTFLDVDDINIKIVIYRSDGLYCCGVHVPFIAIKEKEQGNNKAIDMRINSLNLLSGEYFIDLFFHNNSGRLLKYVRKASGFIVNNALTNDDGIVSLPYCWQ